MDRYKGIQRGPEIQFWQFLSSFGQKGIPAPVPTLRLPQRGPKHLAMTGHNRTLTTEGDAKKRVGLLHQAFALEGPCLESGGILTKQSIAKSLDNQSGKGCINTIDTPLNDPESMMPWDGKYMTNFPSSTI